ncbi:MAG: histidine kinase dimerization/phospho-acceptor domain-containing protein [Phycisphaerales bacterium]
MPLPSQDGPVGVLALRLLGPQDRLPGDQRQLSETLTAQLAISIQRERLHEQARRVQIEMEAERARSDPLSSVLHDLRTLLAVISGTSSSLLDTSARFDEQTRLELVKTIHEESARLSKLVENLLYMPGWSPGPRGSARSGNCSTKTLAQPSQGSINPHPMQTCKPVSRTTFPRCLLSRRTVVPVG